MTQDELIDGIIDRFRRGQAATVSKSYTFHSRIGPAMRDTVASTDKKVKVYFIPRALCEDGDTGLLIVAGSGTYEMTSTTRITGFVLLGKGFKPIELANDVAAIANAITARMSENANRPALAAPQE